MDIVYIKKTPSAEPLILEPVTDTIFVLSNTEKKGGRELITLRLQKAGVRAFIFGTFETESKKHLSITQEHHAPNTESHVLLKTVVKNGGDFFYEGTLHIATGAKGANASQEARGLLLSEKSKFKAIPALEILPSDVMCHHKASVAPLNADALFTLQTKGLAPHEARKVLEEAFLKSAFDILERWGLTEKEIATIKT